MKYQLLSLACWVTLSQAAALSRPEFSLMQPQGLRIAYPATSATSLVAFHYSVNQPLSGVAAGKYNVDINSPTTINGRKYFVHENPNLQLSPGDKVNYWFLAIENGQGLQQTAQSFVVPAPTTTAQTQPPTTRPPATQDPVTQAPATPPPRGSTPSGATLAPTPPPTAGPTVAPPSGTSKPPQNGGSGGSGGGGGSCGCKGGGVPIPTCTSYPCLVFDEEFDKLDVGIWEHEITAGGGGNWEFQYYTNNRSNSYVRDSKLYIKPTLTTDNYGPDFLNKGTLDIWGTQPANLCTGPGWYGCMRVGTPTNIINPIQSARLRTVNSFSFTYGKVEVRAKLPSGDWIWPAIWMLPKRFQYGEWPASGEIDIMESRGNKNVRNSKGEGIGNDHVGQTLHWGPFWPINGYEKSTVQVKSPAGTFADGFHTYGVEWTEDYIRFFVDGQETLTVDPGADGFWKFGEFDKLGVDNPWAGNKNKMCPFDHEFYLILNVAVGGTNGYFPDNAPWPKPWRNPSNQALLEFWNARGAWYQTWNPKQNKGEDAAMVVDSVKVWKLKP